MSRRSIYIGFDARQADAFAVARHSTKRRLNSPIQIHGLVLTQLRAMGVYTRPHEERNGQMWCPISGAGISTEFANSRFLTPKLAGSGYALFMDSDMLVRADLSRLFDLCESDPTKAVWCVQHDYRPKDTVKMDGQEQAQYHRKNWSSVMMFNCDHPAMTRLSLRDINERPGRDLHRFFWLEDSEIGALGWEWNYLVGYTKKDGESTPQIVHFTEGTPAMPGYEDSEFAKDWWRELWSWAG